MDAAYSVQVYREVDATSIWINKVVRGGLTLKLLLTGGVYDPYVSRV